MFFFLCRRILQNMTENGTIEIGEWEIQMRKTKVLKVLVAASDSMSMHADSCCTGEAIRNERDEEFQNFVMAQNKAENGRKLKEI